MTKMNNKQPKAVTKSKFQISVEGTDEISTAYHKGIQAIKNCDRGKIIAEALSDIDGSVDIDNAVKHIYPNDNRWDYAIGYKNKVCYIEVHPAYTGEVEKIAQKLLWLKGWLNDRAPLLSSLPKAKIPFVWLSTGGVHIIPQSKQYKRLSTLGIKLTRIHKLCDV